MSEKMMGGVPEAPKQEKIESKRTSNSTIFRDGKGWIYEIQDKADKHAGNFIPGGAGHESKNSEYEFATMKETEGFVEEEGSNDGDNLAGFGGLHFSPENWKSELDGRDDLPREVKNAIQKSIEEAEKE